jgi:hypothetical protein
LEDKGGVAEAAQPVGDLLALVVDGKVPVVDLYDSILVRVLVRSYFDSLPTVDQPACEVDF